MRSTSKKNLSALVGPLLAGLMLTGALALAGCGSSGGPDEGSDVAQIKKIVRTYFEHPSAARCSTMTTAAFRAVFYSASGEDPLPGCEENQDELKTLPKHLLRISIQKVSIEGNKANVEARIGGSPLPLELTRSGSGWRLDSEEEVPEESKETSAEEEGALPGETGAEVKVLKAVGESVHFKSLAGVSPVVSAEVTAEKPIDPGEDRHGADGTRSLITLPSAQAKKEQLRFVNLPVKVENTGPRAFDAGVFAVLYDSAGGEYGPLGGDAFTGTTGLEGRDPNWALGAIKGLSPHSSATRYLTFAIPANDPVVKWDVQLEAGGLPEPALLTPAEGATFLVKK